MRILIVIGTRPEAIKMLPLARVLKKHSEFEVVICDSGQHGDLVTPIFDYFGEQADISLDVMMNGAELSVLSERLIRCFDRLFEREHFDLVMTHGDTTTAFCASLSAFYKGIRVAHVEAGLRTHDVHSPFPEEFDRVAIDAIADIHFAPTPDSAYNLLQEGRENIYVVGNTVIDALGYTVTEDYRSDLIDEAAGRRILLMTVHRRETIGDKMKEIFEGIRDILAERKDIFGVLPMHPNMTVRKYALSTLSGIDNIKLCEPLLPYDLHNILCRSYAVMTDSGGIQEEASYLGIPVFLLRNETEREEGIRSGNIIMLGTDRDGIKKKFFSVVDDRSRYNAMKHRSYVFGQCGACNKIAEILLSFFEKDDIM